VSRKVARQKARVEELTDELAIGAAMRLRCDSAEIHPVVKAVVDYLVKEYPAQDLYIPADLKPGAYPVDAIRAAVKSGKSIRSVCRQFRIDRRTVYRLMDETSPEAS
jgi:hypothetical protein